MRVLVVDDEAAIRDAYRSILEVSAEAGRASALADLAEDLFGDDAGLAAPAAAGAAEVVARLSHVDYASQGLEAVDRVRAAVSGGEPYQVIFLDMRMPPGIDGRETARLIRELDRDVNIVIVSGYSEHNVADVAVVAGPASKLYYVSKPFEVQEIRQLASALGERHSEDSRALKAQIEALERSNAEIRASRLQALRAAYEDSLTGAPNRAAFVRELGTLLEAGGRFHLALIDLHRFKRINDALGQVGGDEWLRLVWQDLNNVVGRQIFAARLGADEFGLLFKGVDDIFAEAALGSLVQALGRERRILGQLVTGGACAGLTSYDGQGDEADIMSRADLALRAAKAAGRCEVRLFDQALENKAREQRQIEEGLAHAVDRDELSLVFQPILEQSNQRIVGFEALIRWTSPALGTVSPAVFIPVAEQCGLIHQLTDWIVPNALAACANWRDQYVSINFSPRDLRRPGLVESLRSRTLEAGLAPGRVQLEVTETALFENDADSANALQQLRSLGFRVALDDFGTGYSSLFHLKNFEIDCIKIDKSFVDSLGTDQSSSAIVVSVAHLARALGVTVVAEGVEDAKQMAMLRLAGCSHVQGYFIGKPMAAEKAMDLVSRPDASMPVSPGARDAH